MPYPEGLTRNRAKTERVWLERDTTTTGCIRLEERRWCYEHIPPQGNRAEMLERSATSTSRGVYIGAMYYYIVDLISMVWSMLDRRRALRNSIKGGRRPRSRMSSSFSIAARSGQSSRSGEYQKMYDEGLQIALKYFGE